LELNESVVDGVSDLIEIFGTRRQADNSN